MEIRYPILFIISSVVVLLILLFWKKKKGKYDVGIKVANTSFLEANPYYQKKIKQYKILLGIIKVACLVAIFSSLVLLSRPAKVKTEHPREYNRDIVLCMDVSGSVFDLDYEITENFKDTVAGLKGERIGISLFNSSSVTLLPLTDDYDYTLSVLDDLQKSFQDDIDYTDDDALYYAMYSLMGTNEGEGGSLIGDGLSSCVFQFSNLEEERTRIIIFSTDNSLAGTPMVTIQEAAAIAKKYGIIVYGVSTKNTSLKDKQEFQKAVELTGGKLYDSNSSTTKDIIAEINKTSKSLFEGKVQTTKTDLPTIPFTVLMVSTVLFIIIRKRVVI